MNILTENQWKVIYNGNHNYYPQIRSTQKEFPNKLVLFLCIHQELVHLVHQNC